MNRITLVHHPIPPTDRPEWRPDYIWTALFIDGREVTSRRDSRLTSLREMVDSLGGDGEFYIVTCTCGEAGCIGIYRGVSVRHSIDGIHWQLGDAALGTSFTAETEFVFAREEYRATITDAIAQARAILRTRPGESLYVEPADNGPILGLDGTGRIVAD